MSCCRINCRSCLNSFLTEQYLPWYLEKEVWKGWCSSASGYYFLNHLGPFKRSKCTTSRFLGYILDWLDSIFDLWEQFDY